MHGPQTGMHGLPTGMHGLPTGMHGLPTGMHPLLNPMLTPAMMYQPGLAKKVENLEKTCQLLRFENKQAREKDDFEKELQMKEEEKRENDERVRYYCSLGYTFGYFNPNM
jgi:hypothetical protein